MSNLNIIDTSSLLKEVLINTDYQLLFFCADLFYNLCLQWIILFNPSTSSSGQHSSRYVYVVTRKSSHKLHLTIIHFLLWAADSDDVNASTIFINFTFKIHFMKEKILCKREQKTKFKKKTQIIFLRVKILFFSKNSIDFLVQESLEQNCDWIFEYFFFFEKLW